MTADERVSTIGMAIDCCNRAFDRIYSAGSSESAAWYVVQQMELAAGYCYKVANDVDPATLDLALGPVATQVDALQARLDRVKEMLPKTD